MERPRWQLTLIAAAGGLLTVAVIAVGVESSFTGLLLAVILLGGPAWALAFCVASEPEDFASASRSREEWLRLLPWTFVLAPLIVPNMVLLGAFFRDSRADGGRGALSWDRMRPGEADVEHHWPE